MQFSKRFSNIALEKIRCEDLNKKYEYDMPQEFTDIGMRFIEELELLRPYGESNPKPVFIVDLDQIKNFLDNLVFLSIPVVR